MACVSSFLRRSASTACGAADCCHTSTDRVYLAEWKVATVEASHISPVKNQVSLTPALLAVCASEEGHLGYQLVARSADEKHQLHERTHQGHLLFSLSTSRRPTVWNQSDKKPYL